MTLSSEIALVLLIEASSEPNILQDDSLGKGEQGTAGLDTNTVMKQTNELCF